MLRHFTARDGYIWKSKLTGDLLSSELYLGKEDTIDNYEEVLEDAVNQEFEQEGAQKEY